MSKPFTDRIRAMNEMYGLPIGSTPTAQKRTITNPGVSMVWGIFRNQERFRSEREQHR